MVSDHSIAFNAALVIFASLMIISASKEPLNDTSVGIKVNHSRPYIENAIEALRRLDSGNRVIERCVEYLSQLSLILNAMGKWDTIHYPLCALFFHENEHNILQNIILYEQYLTTVK